MSGSGDSFGAAGTCAPHSELEKGGVWFSQEIGTSNVDRVALLLPDTVKAVKNGQGKISSVSGNFAVIDVPESEDVVLIETDLSGRTSEIDLGDLMSPEAATDK
jgi:hypothetical protein